MDEREGYGADDDGDGDTNIKSDSEVSSGMSMNPLNRVLCSCD